MISILIWIMKIAPIVTMTVIGIIDLVLLAIFLASVIRGATSKKVESDPDDYAALVNTIRVTAVNVTFNAFLVILSLEIPLAIIVAILTYWDKITL